MIIQSKYNTTPIYGIIAKKHMRFDDCDLFKADLWVYGILKSISVWWGTPSKSGRGGKCRTLLGIQCRYKNMMTGEEIESQKHCGPIDSSDIFVKIIELKPGDFFNQFHIGFDNNISFIKFCTKNGEKIEFGEPIKDDLKQVPLNFDKEPNMLQCFVGYFDGCQITALGCKYISKKNYIFINIMNILRLRHFFKVNEKEKNKWSDTKLLNSCSLIVKTLAKVCLLPDSLFFCIIKYCG